MAFQANVRDLLEAGVHFGHQTKRWNPKMRPYIFTSRDGIHIIDLDQTARRAELVYKLIADTVSLGNTVLFVGTKKQAKDIIETEAKRCGQYYVTNRWLGGMLTNFRTIRQSIDRLNYLNERKEKGDLEKLTKKEALRVGREINKLEFSLGGIKTMTRQPGAVFIIDPNNEDIAKKEAIKLGIPVIALTDTNSNPDGIDYLIPGNDDAIRSIAYFSKVVADACEEGMKRREIALREQAAVEEKRKKDPRTRVVADKETKIGGKGRAWVAKREGEAATAEEMQKFAKASAPKVGMSEAKPEAKPEIKPEIKPEAKPETKPEEETK